MTSKYTKSIGRDAAIALAKTEWWVGRTPRDIALVGMLTRELCLPFNVLHEALETALGRPVFTHELVDDSIIEELRGERDMPTMEEIIGKFPAEKRVIIKTAP